jgi:S-adenosylmethionine/arginine decarboxylase-like enzyme
VRFLDDHLDPYMDVQHRDARVLGEQCDGLQWHVYVAQRADAGLRKPTFNIEISMTELGQQAARQFYRGENFVSAEQTTRDTGIVQLKPGAIIDDYVFEPCGYSMNGILHTGFITIHVTPEKGFSYASVEVSGCREDAADPSHLVAMAARIFRPGKMSMAVTTDGSAVDAE